MTTNGHAKRLRHEVHATSCPRLAGDPECNCKALLLGTCRICTAAGVYATGACSGVPAAASSPAPALPVVGSDVAQPAPDTVTPFVDEIAHAVIQLGMLERQAGTPITFELPDGRTRRFGDLLLELGDYVYKHEQPKPRILSPGLWRPDK